MAQHGRDNDKRGVSDERLNEHASRASELLAARANDRRRSAGAQPDSAPRASQPRPRVADDDRLPAQQYPKGIVEFVRQNIVYIAGVAAVAVIVAIGLVVLSAVMPKSEAGSAVEAESYQSPYNWENLDRTDSRYQYVVDGQTKSRLGVDVSENQQGIDWDAVASDGIDFVMVRLGYRGATEGDLYLDDRYWENLSGARSAGIDCGVYFFSQARTVDEAVEEAEFVIDQLGGIELEYPIAFDSEEVALGVESARTSGLGSDEMTAIADAFCNRVEQAGYRSMVYGNPIDLTRYDGDMLDRRPVWWAEYNVSAPAHYVDIVMWQYSNGGQVAGIPTAVDMNIDLSDALS